MHHNLGKNMSRFSRSTLLAGGLDVCESDQSENLPEASDRDCWLLTGCRDAKVCDEKWAGMMREGKDARSLDVTSQP